ncbi:GGDEF domain-containing protein [Chromobacterium phragmitis]|uniref:sensor domain-containing diguanylate cyclase n=1 Tax=Chromobacterium phragmitis TaxID=2202141 RepID=UPI000DEC91FD|nr:sensor domain-containing diguanylate cyclase [Chromobacterium phragmitis]AXE30238.1 GGDEF domain-containing protein [Chromobacterium phragmitis]
MSGPFSRYRLAIIVALLLLAGIVVNAGLYYQQGSQDIRHGIVEQGLPLTGDTIFSEIDKSILRPLSVASLMANDTFLLDWLKEGERAPDRVARYLAAINGRYGITGSFLVSESTHRYYYAGGVLKTVSPADREDRWYFHSRQTKQAYDIALDEDMTNGGKTTLFINHRMLDGKGKLLGVIGVGLPQMELSAQLAAHEQRFQRRIYFIDQSGRIVLDSSGAAPRKLAEQPGLGDLASAILAGGAEPQKLEYSRDGNRYLLTSRLLPELGWHLLVEQNETRALQPLHAALQINLAINTAILLLVLIAVVATLQHHQQRMRQMATTDPLTGCLNRLAFMELLPGWLRACQRASAEPQLLMIDIDHFKQVNDKHGHQVGDQVLREIAELLRTQLRGGDLLIRWGGEEFVALVTSHGEDDALAERLRNIVARHVMNASGQALTITISIGLCQWLPPETLEAAVARADLALYAAKQGGRNRVCHAQPYHPLDEPIA